MKFKIRGRSYVIEKKDVIEKMRGEEPGDIDKYYVILEGKKFPIKQVIEVVCGIPLIGFTSMDAYRILEKLGFEIEVRQ